MSDFVGSRYDKQEDFQVLLSKKDHRESPQHKHYLWMAHWTKASSSAEPENNITNPLEDINKGKTTKHSDTLPYEFMKSTIAERLMVGVSRRSASMQHAQQFNSSMWGVAHHVCNDLGPKNNEHVDEPFEKSMKKNAVNLHARAVVSETYSVHKLSELPLDFQKLGSSEDPSSDWSHFPMFEINRKIDNILNPKRRSSLGPASLNLNMSAPHVMALSPQEYRMNSHQIADEDMEMCKSARAFASHIEDPAGLNSDPSGQKLKRKLLDTMSCSCSKDDNESSDCPIDDQHTSHYFAKANHELPCASNEKKLTSAANNNNRIVSSAFHNLKTRRSAVRKQQYEAEAMFCAPLLGREFQNEPITISNNRKKDGENFHEMYKSHGKAVSCSLQPYEQQHLKTQRVESAANLKGCMLSDQSPNKLTEKSKSNGELLAHGAKSKEIYTGKSSGFGVCMYGTNIGSQLFGGQNQSSTKTETLYSDTLIRSKSSAGLASVPAQKDYGCPGETKSEQLVTTPQRGDSRFSKDDTFHNIDGEMIGRAKEDQGLDEGNNELEDKQETSSVPAKSMNSWIGRWCQSGTSVFHEDPGQGRQETKPDQPSEELEGQFPSIAAMAMMGRVMNKLRPCEHQKKGPFVVWKTD
ncbi:unnamed protein product [Urochloa humidicola]